MNSIHKNTAALCYEQAEVAYQKALDLSVYEYTDEIAAEADALWREYKVAKELARKVEMLARKAEYEKRAKEAEEAFFYAMEGWQ